MWSGIDQRQLTLGPRLLTSSEDTRRRDLMVMVMLWRRLLLLCAPHVVSASGCPKSGPGCTHCAPADGSCVKHDSGDYCSVTCETGYHNEQSWTRRRCVAAIVPSL